MSLAIVIPYFKLTFFEKTLQSLAAQTDKRFKVYIGDDNSPESPAALLENYKDKIDLVYVKFGDNLGSRSLTKQWNRCLALVQQEEWIMILGDDDYVSDNLVANWHASFPIFDQKCTVVRFATQSVNEKTNSISAIFIHPQWEKAAHFYQRKYQGETRSSLSEMVFTKEIYRAKGFRNYPLAWHSDDKAWLDFANGNPVFTINDSTVFVRLSDLNITGVASNKDKKATASIQFFLEVLAENLAEFDNHFRLKLLMDTEILIKKHRKISPKEWRLFFQKYWQQFQFFPLLKLVRRYLMSFT